MVVLALLGLLIIGGIVGCIVSCCRARNNRVLLLQHPRFTEETPILHSVNRTNLSNY